MTTPISDPVTFGPHVASPGQEQLVSTNDDADSFEVKKSNDGDDDDELVLRATPTPADEGAYEVVNLNDLEDKTTSRDEIPQDYNDQNG